MFHAFCFALYSLFARRLRHFLWRGQIKASMCISKRSIVLLCMIITVVLGAVSLCGCHVQPDTPTEPRALSEQERADIHKALEKAGLPQSFSYYGTYNGYDVIVPYPDMSLSVMCSVSVGEFEFKFGCQRDLYTYKDGEIAKLVKIYGQALITKAQMEQIYEEHINFDYSTNYYHPSNP